jgi:hypothetical protein
MGVTNLDELKLDKTAKVASADAVVAAGSAPTKAEFDAVVALVNEMKTKLNAIFQA